MADTLKTEQTLLTGSIPAIAGIEDPSQARMILYQAGRPVHAPLDNVGLATSTEMSTAIEAAIDATATAETRNRIVNPAMQIVQEGATPVTANGAYICDQWNSYHISSAGVFTRVLVSLANYTVNGNSRGIRCTITTPDATLAAGEYLSIAQPIEGTRMRDFCWGFAQARQIIVRFGFRGPAGTYAMAITNASEARAYVASFTITAGQANTETTQTFVVPGDTTGTWAVDTGIGCYFYIVLAAGTTWQGVTGWQTGPKYGVTGMSNGMGTGGAIFELTDVCLYLDPLATGIAPPWVMPDEAEELQACQRYWTKGSDNWSGYATTGVGFATPIFFGVTMRIGPAMTFVNTGNAGFPATASTATATSVQGTNANRTANGTGAAAFNDTWVANARM